LAFGELDRAGGGETSKESCGCGELHVDVEEVNNVLRIELGCQGSVVIKSGQRMDVFIKKVLHGHRSCLLGKISCLSYTSRRIGGVEGSALRCFGAQMVLSSVVAIYLNCPVMKI
jgi:hypothetical protein